MKNYIGDESRPPQPVYRLRTESGRLIEIFVNVTSGGYRLLIDGKERDFPVYRLTQAIAAARRIVREMETGRSE